MIGSTHSIRPAVPVSIVLVMLVSSIGQAGTPTGLRPRLIEVFSTSDLPVTGGFARDQRFGFSEIILQVFELDRIERIQADLSKQLSPDPERSKHIVLQLIQQWDKKSRIQIQSAALGLVKAMQYRIDRYPAIVLDGEIVIYGVTDLREALNRYRQWQAGEEQ